MVLIPEQIENIKFYAPEMARNNSYFEEKYLHHLYKVEENNFWYRSRNRVIKRLFKKYVNPLFPKNIMEIGCGNGAVLKAISEYKNYTLCGTDVHITGLKNAKERLPHVEFIQLDATNISFKDNFDAIGAFDVLEHIEEDTLVIKNIYTALKPGGKLLISVPQHQWIWSHMDELDNHKRRYSREDLKQKLNQNDFEIIYITSFVFTLFPLMIASRYFKRTTKFKEQPFENKLNELNPGMFINFILEGFMRIDEFLLKVGIQLPFGGSLIVVAKK